MPWNFVLQNKELKSIGEIQNCSSRSITRRLSGVSTATFTIRGDNPLLRYMLEADTWLQVWRKYNVLDFYGRVISVQFTGEDEGGQPPSATVTCADAAWELQFMLTGRGPGGYYEPNTKFAQMAEQMISSWETITLLTSKIYLNGSGASCTAEGTYREGPWKPILSCYGDISQGSAGFDWIMTPTVAHTGKTHILELADLYGNANNTAAIFEYGAGKRNMQKMTYLRDMSTMCNVAFLPPVTGEPGNIGELPNGESLQAQENTASIAAHGPFEQMVELSGVQNTAKRKSFLEAEVAIRGNPRHIVTFTPELNGEEDERVPIYGTEYFLGDQVYARAALGGAQLFNGLVRIYAITINIDEAGTVSIEPTLVNEGGDTGGTSGAE